MNQKLGVDYYPEQWPEAWWVKDAAMMVDLGLTYVRIGEFAWSLLEPEDGRTDFAWLDRAVAILSKAGLQIVMGTPTAAPPPWLSHKHDMFQRDENRLVLGPGSRRHVCANNPHYIAHAQKIVTAMAQHFAPHRGITTWQIDNEFGCHGTTRCFCDHCHKAFQVWLKDKYGTLEALNAAWGTVFWSAIYTAWEQIPLPWKTPAQASPSLQLDFRRFSSDSWVKFQRLQIDIVRQFAPQTQITHNFMGDVDQQDYFALAQDLDFVAWDNYPQATTGPEQIAYNHDMMRGYKGGKGFWVIEQQPGVVNWDAYNRPVPPQQVRLWTYQGFGHGAEAVMYFRWRAGRFGQEQYHMGVLRQDNTPTRLYDEIVQMKAELARVPAFRRQAAPVAILFDFNDLWAIQIDPHQKDFSYRQFVKNLYRELWQAGINVDMVRRGTADLSAYKAVFVPAPLLIDAQEADSWRDYVRQGGRLLVGFRAFAKEQGSNWTDQALPAGLYDLLGLHLDEYLGIPPQMQGTAGDYTYRLWAEVLKPTTAVPLLTYDDHYWAGETAVAQNEFGAGTAVTLGCWFDDPLPDPLWEAMGLEELISPLWQHRDELEVIALDFEDGDTGAMLLNHSEQAKIVRPHTIVHSLLEDESDSDMIHLPPLGVAILKWPLT